MSMKYIRDFYNVPSKRGMKILYETTIGTIVGSKDAYLRIRLDGEERVGNYHPTWNIEYLD